MKLIWKKMCQEGWAARKLVEGIWTFEPCKPGQYTYRVAYLRTKTKEEVEELKMMLKQDGIEFVFRYSFGRFFEVSMISNFTMKRKNKEFVKRSFVRCQSVQF